METGEAKEGKRIHFGSLEEVAKERLRAQENGGLSSAVLAGIKAGNINISEGSVLSVLWPNALQQHSFTVTNILNQS